MRLLLNASRMYPRKAKRCSKCGKTGHNRTTCGRPAVTVRHPSARHRGKAARVRRPPEQEKALQEKFKARLEKMRAETAAHKKREGAGRITLEDWQRQAFRPKIAARMGGRQTHYSIHPKGYCQWCGKMLREFTARRDWEDRKFHLSCAKEKAEYERGLEEAGI